MTDFWVFVVSVRASLVVLVCFPVGSRDLQPFVDALSDILLLCCESRNHATYQSLIYMNH